MSDAATTLLQQALALPEPDRRWLADQLDASLGEGESQLPDDPDFRAELDRRLQSIADGTAVLLDGDQVMRELREKYGMGGGRDVPLSRRGPRRSGRCYRLVRVPSGRAR